MSENRYGGKSRGLWIVGSDVQLYWIDRGLMTPAQAEHADAHNAFAEVGEGIEYGFAYPNYVCPFPDPAKQLEDGTVYGNAVARSRVMREKAQERIRKQTIGRPSGNQLRLLMDAMHEFHHGPQVGVAR